jgi:transcriptional regulator with XRE-family HTH domain
MVAGDLYRLPMNADTYLKALGIAFRQRRERLGMTNEQVAEAADINVNYYARIERGEINTSVRKLVAIANALASDFSKLAAAAEKQLKSE